MGSLDKIYRAFDREGVRGSTTFFMLDADRLIASVDTFPYWDTPPIWVVTRLWVAKNYRSQGLATKLMRKVCAWADVTQVQLRLTVEPDEDSAPLWALKAFYHKLGFIGDEGMMRSPIKRK